MPSGRPGRYFNWDLATDLGDIRGSLAAEAGVAEGRPFREPMLGEEDILGLASADLV